MINSRITLGTVQFGLDYGINNKTGKIGRAGVNAILNYALQHQIPCLDTAEAYGDSEAVIGDFICEHPGHAFDIVTKYNFKEGPVNSDSLNKSLSALHVPEVYGYMAHDFSKFKNDRILIQEFLDLKKSGKIRKTGFSLYHPEDLKFLIEHNFVFDMVQVPFNIFDQRFASCFRLLKERNVEIHVRSCFLQGLFFMAPEALPVKLKPLKNKLAGLQEIARSQNLGIAALCLAFCLSFTAIDKLVIGVDSLDNLEENLAMAQVSLTGSVIDDLLLLREDNEQLILPFNW